MNQKTQRFFGLFLILSALALLADAFNLFQVGPSFFRLVATGFLFFQIIRSISPLSFYGIFIPLALIFNLNAPYFHIHNRPWIVLFSSWLLSLGFTILFKKQSQTKNASTNQFQENEAHFDHKFTFRANLRNSHQKIKGEDLQAGDIEVNFSNSSIFLHPESLKEQELILNLSVNFASLVIYISRDFEVFDHLDPILSTINQPLYQGRIQEKRIILQGDLNFARLDIKYI